MASISLPPGTITYNPLKATISNPPGSITNVGEFPILNPSYLFSGITYTQSGNLTYFDSAGVLQTAAVNTMVLDYDPSTLALRGYPFWEARTNSIRNNTMVGAVASVARSVGTPTSATRTASTTVVVASVGHTVSAGDMLTCSGASVAAYNGTYVVSAVVANVSFSYVVASSATDSAAGFTYSVVSPGSVPTNWGLSLGANAASSITAVSTIDGIEYIDLRIVQAVAGADTSLLFEGTTQIVAADTQTWTETLFNQMVGGSTTNLAFSSRLVFRTAAGAAVTAQNVAIVPTTAALRTQRTPNTFTASGGTIARVTPQVIFSFTDVGDITLRIGLPDLEQGAFATPVIKTSTVAVTRGAPSAVISGANFTSFYNQSQGTFVAAGVSGTVVAGAEMIWAVTDGTSAERMDPFLASGGTLTQVVDNNVLQAQLSNATLASFTAYKHAFSYLLNDFNSSLNGGVLATDSGGTIPTVTTLHLGMRNGPQEFLNGWLSSLSYYAVALPNQLRSLST